MDKCGKAVRIRDHAGNQLPDRVCTLERDHDGHHTDGAAYWLNTARLPYLDTLTIHNDDRPQSP